MKKLIGAGLVAILFSAQIASAQGYYNLNSYFSNTNLAYSGSCVSISRDLSVGSKGDDVLKFQQFILSRNYPGGGAWMLTGYFGAATRAGVINFQMDMRLPQTGILDAQTRAALSSLTCGYGSTTPTYNQYPYFNTPVQPWYSYPNYTYGQNYNANCTTFYNSANCQCSWYTVGGQTYNTCGTYNNNYSYGSLAITNVTGPGLIAVNTQGTWTVSLNTPSGSNYTSVSVNWGDSYYGSYGSSPQQIYGIGSQTTSFTHTYTHAGTYSIVFTTTNSYGQSHTYSRTVQVTGTFNTTNPVITSITPMTGSVGTTIQITGSGFTGDNTVHFGVGGKRGVTSMSGNYIYFTVPSHLSPCDVSASGSYCAQYISQVNPGQYQIYVTVNGVNSNSLTFTVQ